MKRLMSILLLAFLMTVTGCRCSDDPIDMDQVNKLVTLSPEDLRGFEMLSEALIEDLPKLRKQYESVTTPGNRTNWMSTNSYYMDLIDSVKYRELLVPLKGKHDDNYWISQSGEIQFGLKNYTRRKCDNYNDNYEHVLIRTSTKNTTPNQSFGDFQKVYIDSMINSNWKYQFFMTHTGW